MATCALAKPDHPYHSPGVLLITARLEGADKDSPAFSARVCVSCIHDFVYVLRESEPPFESIRITAPGYGAVVANGGSTD